MFELCVVTDHSSSNGLLEYEIAELAYSGGADIVQLRMKEHDGKDMLEQAKLIRDVSKRYGKTFIVNDRVDIAMISDADGVHLGQSDISANDARMLLGKEKIIGISVHNVQEAIKAESEGADYVSVGCIFKTSTKKDANENAGLDIITSIRKMVKIPVMVIGGINKDNVQDVINAGADGIAVVSAVVSEKDICAAAGEIKGLIFKAKTNIQRS